MNIAIILFTLGIIMIVAGYTNQVSPQCNTDLKVKVVSRNVYDEIMYNQELTDDTYKDLSKTQSLAYDLLTQKDINEDNILVNMANR